MEMKLIKTEVNYLLKNEEGVIIASTSIKKGINSLSKQNCDSIFGVVDVEKLTKDSYQKYSVHDNKLSLDEQIQRSGGFIVGFKEGFNKVMELNKDKVFTLKDIKKAIEFDKFGFMHGEIDYLKNENEINEFIQSLQQPTEIDVVIVMETCSMNPLDLDCDEIIERPKLDSEGCLILKRVV